MLLLGIGLGVSAGVVLSSGLSFDKSDSARFVGSLMGALIAVSGAVALHYLKEAETRTDRRRHLRALLATARGFGPLAQKDLKEKGQEKDTVTAATEAFRGQFMRACRYAERFEHEDYAISECHSILIINNMNQLIVEDQELIDGDVIRIFRDILDDSIELIDSAIEALDGADSHLSLIK